MPGNESMLREINAEVELTRHLIGRDRLSDEVMAAMQRVPRPDFVGPEMRRHAYINGPLPIGHGQTISQPYIVALMTDLAELGRESRVLEIGTGSGYQAAVLAELVNEVYTIEIIPDLARQAAVRLESLGYSNVHPRRGDGYQGWPEKAPFDAILVTAAAPEVPAPLVAQLGPGGRLVIPVGYPDSRQQLLLLRKSEDGVVTRREILPVVFVPLTGKHRT
jgi:protein-L-isoaspartate(D-aspartate) O-methyltransferase